MTLRIAPGSPTSLLRASISQRPIAVPPSAEHADTARAAARRVAVSARASPRDGYRKRASWVPPTTPKLTPSRSASIAVIAAFWAATILRS